MLLNAELRNWWCTGVVLVVGCSRTGPTRPGSIPTPPISRDVTSPDGTSDGAAVRISDRAFTNCMRRRYSPADAGIFGPVIWPNFMSERLRPRTTRDWLPAPCEWVDPSTCEPTPLGEDDPLGAPTRCDALTQFCHNRRSAEFVRVRSLGGMRDVWIEPAVTCECPQRASPLIDQRIARILPQLQLCVRSTLMPTHETDPILFYTGEFRSDHSGRLVELHLLRDDAPVASTSLQLENTGPTVRVPECLHDILHAQSWPPLCSWAVYFRTRDIVRVPPIRDPGALTSSR